MCHCHSAALPIQSTLKIIVAAWPASIFGFFDKRMNKKKTQQWKWSTLIYVPCYKTPPEIHLPLILADISRVVATTERNSMWKILKVFRSLFGVCERARSFYVCICVNKYIKMPIYKKPLKWDQAQRITEHEWIKRGIGTWHIGMAISFRNLYANFIHNKSHHRFESPKCKLVFDPPEIAPKASCSTTNIIREGILILNERCDEISAPFLLHYCWLYAMLIYFVLMRFSFQTLNHSGSNGRSAFFNPPTHIQMQRNSHKLRNKEGVREWKAILPLI